MSLPFAVAIADSTAAQIITSVTSLCTLIITGVLAYVMAKMKYNQELESQKVAKEVVNVRDALKATTVGTDAKLLDVKDTLVSTTAVTEEKLGELTGIAKSTMETGNKVHILVNSAMATQLRISEIALRRIADLTNHPDDIAAAALALTSYQEHIRNQEHLDVREVMPTLAPPDPERKGGD